MPILKRNCDNLADLAIAAFVLIFHSSDRDGCLPAKSWVLSGFYTSLATDTMSAIDNLLQVMRDLRDPDTGCPWDLRQTSLSIAPHTLDETHEVLDAIESGDIENLKEELGDLLFNIVFHARIAEEQGDFNFDDVVQTIVEKMIRRHPHVFGSTRDQSLSDAQLSDQWNAIKRQEKSKLEPTSPKNESKEKSVNSTIYQALQVQKQAATLGFDWTDLAPVIAKIEEELNELKQAISEGEKEFITEESGDLFFACINLARHTRVNPEIALRQCNQKFSRRFNFVQQQMKAAGIGLDASQLEQMESFWQAAKKEVG